MKKTVSRKANKLGQGAPKKAFRFSRLSATAPALLLSNSALVAGFVGLSMIGTPSAALAAPNCSMGNNGYYICHGGTASTPQPLDINVFDGADHFRANFVDDENDAYSVYVDNGNTAPAQTVTIGAEDATGEINVDPGVSFYNEDGTGFYIDASAPTGADIVVNFDGDTTGGHGYGMEVNGGSSNFTINVSEDGSIQAYGYNEDSYDGLYTHGTGNVTINNSGYIASYTEDGDGIYSSNSGDVSISNDGSIYSYGGDGVYVTGAKTVTVDNHSTHSMVGYLDGLNVGFSGPTSVDNQNGLIYGYEYDGIYAHDLTNTGAGVTLNVDNTHSGVILGGWDGIYVSEDIAAPTEDYYRTSIFIDNSAEVGIVWNEENEDYEAGVIQGGLISGGYYAGVEVYGYNDSAPYTVHGDVVIDNSGTLDKWFGINAQTSEDFEDGLLATFDEDAAQYLYQLGWQASVLTNHDTLDVPRGIIGYDTGVSVDGLDGSVFVYNDGYYSSGVAYSEDPDVEDGYSHMWIDGGQIFGLEGDGIYVSNIAGNVEIWNGNDNEDANEDDPHRRGGVIFGMGEDGIDASNVDGYVDVYNAGGTVYGEWNGVDLHNIKGLYVSYDYEGDEDDYDYYYGAYIDNSDQGVIWGNGEDSDGVHGWGITGDVTVDNTEGLIYGQDDGIYLGKIDIGDVNVYNGGGRIVGFYGDGITINGVTSEDLTYSEDVGGGAYIENGQYLYDEASEEWTWGDGGLIYGADSAIDIDARWAGVYNATGGAIIGDGSEDQAVINIDTQSNTYYFSSEDDYYYGYDGQHSAELYNDGLIVSQAMIDRGWHAPDATDLPNPVAEGALGGQLDDPLTSDQYAALFDAADAAWNFAATAGAGGALFSEDSDGYDLADFQNAANDFALTSSGGSIFVGNSGLMVGRVSVSGTDYNEDTYLSSGGYSGNTIENSGVWFTGGSSYFGASGYNGGGVWNHGLIQTAFDSEENETTTFYSNNYMYLANGYVYPDEYNYYEDGFDYAPGILSMTDGGAGDQFDLEGSFYGTEFYSLQQSEDFQVDWSNPDITSFIATDVDFGTEISDEVFVEGEYDGLSKVIFNVVGTGTQGIGETIDVLTAGYVYGDLGIDERSDGFTVVDGQRVLQDGLYAWYMDFDGDNEDGGTFQLVSTWGPQAVQMPSLITAVQSVWHETSSQVEDHLDGLHFPTSGGGSGADLAVGEVPVVADDAPTTGLWAKISGSWTDSTTTVTPASNSIPTAAIDTGVSQNTYSILAGGDMTPVSTGDGGSIRLGIFGGYIQSNVSLDTYGGSADMTGGTLGAYASYTNGGFYLDGELKADMLSMTYKAPIAGDFEADANATSIGFVANTGYRFDTGSIYIEPIATVAYVTTDIDDLTVGNAGVSFSQGESLRAAVGARIGTTIASGGDTTTELSLLGKIWNEFEDANEVTLTDGNNNTATFSDDISGLFGEVRATGTLYNNDKSFSAFASTGVKWNDDFTTVDAKLGVRKGF